MNNKTKIFLLVVLVIGIISSVLYFYMRSYIPKYRWVETYDHRDNQPYGLKLAREVFQASHPHKHFILIDKPLNNYLPGKDSTGIYVFIGSNFECDSAQCLQLTNFVKKGNNVFISSIHSSHYLFSIFTNGKQPTIYYENYEDSTVNLSFGSSKIKPDYHFQHADGKKLSPYSWAGIDSVVFTDTLLGYGFERISIINNELTDCFRLKYGKGWFIFHFNPILLTNYNLSKETGFRYLNELLSAYNKPDIYWDEFSTGTDLNNDMVNRHESPLRFILSEKSLRWSWYLSIFFILLFLLFNAKRKQASIPLLPDNKNTTVEFIHSIAGLHYKNNSTAFLTDEIHKQFLSFVKSRYGISPQLEKGEMIRLLPARSGIPEQIVNDLFKHYVSAQHSPDNEITDLLEFYKLTEYFYQNCI